MNRVVKIYTKVLLLTLIFSLVLFVSCSKNEKSEPVAQEVVSTAKTESVVDVREEEPTTPPVVTVTSTTITEQYEYYYSEDDADEEEIVASPIEEEVIPSQTEETIVPSVDETSVEDTSSTSEAVTLPMKEEKPVVVTPIEVVDSTIKEEVKPTEDVIVEEVKKGVKNTFALSINPYAVGLKYNDVSENTALLPYGFNAFLEYRLHLVDYLFVGFGGGIEYFSGRDAYTNVPFLFKVGATCPILSSLKLDVYATLGAELNNTYRHFTAFVAGAGFDFAYSFNDNMALLFGFEYRYSSGKDLSNTSITLHRFILPTISFAYTI